MPRSEELNWFNSEKEEILNEHRLDFKRRMASNGEVIDDKTMEEDSIFQMSLFQKRYELWNESNDYMAYEAVLNKNQY